MKKIFTTVAMILYGISVFPYDFMVGGIYYNIISEANLTVEVTYKDEYGQYHLFNGVDGQCGLYCEYSGNIKIPSEIAYYGKTYKVTRIGKNAFATDSWSLYGSYDYNYRTENNLKSIEIPETVVEIDASAFKNCKALDNIVLPSSLISIGSDAFDGCTFYSLKIPPTVSTIGSHPFPNTLKELIMLSYIPPSGGRPFGITDAEIIVPSKDKYNNDANWKSYTIIEMLTPSTNSFVYNGKEQIVNWTNNLKAYTMNEPIMSMQKDAGTYTTDVKANFYKENQLYFSVVFPYEYEIKKTSLIIKIENANRLYGDDNPPFKIYYSGFVNEENENIITTKPSISTTATKTSNVGEYPIIISGGSAKNYEFVYERGVLTIEKAPLSAKVNDTTKVYGTQNPTFTIKYYGLKNNESEPKWSSKPYFKTDAIKTSEVGQYEITAVNGIPVNYNLVEISSGKLSITPATLTIKANDATRLYYSENPTFNYNCIGFVNGDDESSLVNKPILSTNASYPSNVGSYEIVVGETSSPNYSISYINGTLTITPRTITAYVGNYERFYNEDNPEFEVKYYGFVGDDDENALNTKSIASTKATKESDVGTYTINVYEGNADNYIFSYSSGILTINRAEQTISWEQDLSGLKVGDQVELKAVASSGLPITYTLDNSNAAEAYSTGIKSYLDCKAGGQFLIRAVQNGNKNYYSTPRVSNMISIIGSNPTTDPTLTIKQADNGTVSTQVSKGSVYTFTIVPSDGWSIHSVTYNDTDVTGQLSNNNTFTTPSIVSNSTLYVAYEEGGNSVYSAQESSVRIQPTSDGVKIVDANIGDLAYVYTTDGLLIHSVKVNSQTINIPLTKDNVYIIKVGKKTVKLGY